MRRLALECDISKMSILYEETTVSWNNAEFTFNKDLTAHLKVWEDDIEPEQISETWKRLKERIESFRIGLKYDGNRSVEIKRGDYPTYYVDDKIYTPRTEKEIVIITDYLRGRITSFGMAHLKVPTPKIRFIASVSPAPLPSNMPTVPPDLHRTAETIVAADELAKYPDEVMKLAYVVLEEVEPTVPDEFRLARNFVSHHVCKDSSVIAFVKADLPSAVVPDGVQFSRNNGEHIAFVAKYAYPALQRAKELFKAKVIKEGGFL